MKVIDLYGLIPIKNFFTEKKKYDIYLVCLNSYIKNLSKMLTHLNGNFKHIRAKKIKPNKSILQMFNLINPLSFGFVDNIDFIRIDVKFEIDEIKYKKLNPNFKITKMDLVAAGACELALLLKDTLILANLCFPGHLHSCNGRVFYRNYPFNIIYEVCGFSSDVFYEKEFGNWPELKLLEPSRVINWEKRLNLFKDGFGVNPVQKAFAAYTHIFKHTTIDTFELLFWAMQGLEGFYCDGKGELRYQLKEKSKLFLGEWEDKKNIVGQLYDLRSKFVHGDFPIERWNNNRFESKELEKEYDKLNKGTCLALQILISTLQKCVEDDIIDIKYHYRLEVKKHNLHTND